MWNMFRKLDDPVGSLAYEIWRTEKLISGSVFMYRWEGEHMTHILSKPFLSLKRKCASQS